MIKMEKKNLPPQVMTRPQPQGVDLNTAFNKLVGNTATIAQHCQAMKLVAKGIDVDPIEKANTENQNLLVAVAAFMNKMGVGGKKMPRAQRRRLEREVTKQNKKRRKR